jgi:hypothetical protein
MAEVQKIQMNSLVPEEIDTYVEGLHGELGIGKSELVHLFIAYFKVNFSRDEISALAREMLIFGEQGLRTT